MGGQAVQVGGWCVACATCCSPAACKATCTATAEAETHCSLRIAGATVQVAQDTNGCEGGPAASRRSAALGLPKLLAGYQLFLAGTDRSSKLKEVQN